MKGVVPCHLQVLRAHQSRLDLQVGEEDQGSQNEKHETQIGISCQHDEALSWHGLTGRGNGEGEGICASAGSVGSVREPKCLLSC